MSLRTLLIVFCISVITCSTAWAHPQVGSSVSGGLLAGFAHPWLGLDHLLAMVAVGLLSVEMGGRAIRLLPLTFVGTMIVGGALGLTGIQFGFVEYGVVLSVIVLGAALAAGQKYPLALATVVTGIFGLMHGHVHGTEIPALAAPALYASGFVTASAALHIAGIVAAFSVVRTKREFALRLSGAAICLVGLILLAGAM